MIAKSLLKDLQERTNVVYVTINFSAQTSSLQTQEIIESKLERKRKTILGKNPNLNQQLFLKVYLVDCLGIMFYAHYTQEHRWGSVSFCLLMI